MFTREQVVDANIKLHSHLADKYKDSEPHYRKENIESVTKIIKKIQAEKNSDNLLDVGCGMGFMIDIAKNYVKQIRGIDITQAMIDKIKIEEGEDIKVMISEIENMPFSNNEFGIVTAYAVLHHLHDLHDAFKEIFRVLREGGVFYTALDPNYYFWKELSTLDEDKKYSDIVIRELNAVKHKDDELESEFGVDKEILAKAEKLKHIDGGLKEEELVSILKAVGFRKVEIRYEWYLGEGKYINDAEKSKYSEEIKDYLKAVLPLSKHLFKYVSIYAEK